MYFKKVCRSFVALMLALTLLLPLHGLATAQSEQTKQQIVLTQFDGSTIAFG